MKLGKRTLGACSCLLAPSKALPKHMDRVVELSELYTDEWHRGKGIANRLLDKICEEADRANMVLMLMPENDWLSVWYETHGFQIIQTKPQVMMARPPYVHSAAGWHQAYGETNTQYCH